jgi:hypothetical protein
MDIDVAASVGAIKAKTDQLNFTGGNVNATMDISTLATATNVANAVTDIEEYGQLYWKTAVVDLTNVATTTTVSNAVTDIEEYGALHWTTVIASNFVAAPTKEDIRSEIDTNSTQLASLVSGVTLSATQSLYAPSKAGDEMDLVNVPNSIAITAIQSGLAMASALGTLAAKLTGITSLVKILQGLFRKDTMDVTAKSEINDGVGTYDEATDSLQAIADKPIDEWVIYNEDTQVSDDSDPR